MLRKKIIEKGSQAWSLGGFRQGGLDQVGRLAACHDSRSRVTGISHQNSSGTVLSSESYSYDPASNLSAKTLDSVTTSFGYDNANQLLPESRTGYSASYSYDANGNRTSQTLNGTTFTHSVDNGDKLNSISSGGSTVKSYSYDAAGRTTGVTTSAGTTSLSYDYESRVVGISYPSTATNSFSYNGFDARVGKTDSAGTWTYKRDGTDPTSSVLSDGFAAYTPAVSRHTSSSTTFEGGDIQGTNRVETNSSQSVSATRTYDAFGNLESTTGTPAGPFGYVGQEGYQEDSDSGLKLLGERYYDPSTGRFLTRDPIGEGENWYTYCASNPMASSDASGLDPAHRGTRNGKKGKDRHEEGEGRKEREQRQAEQRRIESQRKARNRKKNYQKETDTLVNGFNPLYNPFPIADPSPVRSPSWGINWDGLASYGLAAAAGVVILAANPELWPVAAAATAYAATR